MHNITIRPWWLVCVVAGCSGLLVAGASPGCLAIADVGDIEFGSTSRGGTGGGSGLSGGGSGPSGGGGVGPTCTDGQMNGNETGIDCGGPECDPCSEDCTNGVDDDGNALVDCADPLCAGYECVPEVPQDWSGPVAIFIGANDAALPNCGSGWPNRSTGGSGTFSAAPAQCSPCSCGDPTGATCDAPTLTFYGSVDCTGSVVDERVIAAAPGNCDSFPGSSRNSVTASALAVTGATCPPSGGAATIEPEVWGERHVMCEGADLGAGCTASNQICVRTPESPFETLLCISQVGDLSCPGQDYTAKTIVYTSVTDTRDCADCACSDPAGISCDGATTVFGNQSCSQDETAVLNDGTTCAATSSMRSARYTVVSGPTGGSCSPLAGAATGSATPGDPVTICCL